MVLTSDTVVIGGQGTIDSNNNSQYSLVISSAFVLILETELMKTYWGLHHKIIGILGLQWVNNRKVSLEDIPRWSSLRNAKTQNVEAVRTRTTKGIHLKKSKHFVN